jgi:hypothetical protein
MKTITLVTAFFLVSTVQFFAQPILSQSDIGFQIGDIQVIDSISFIDLSDQTGAGMTWDLNGLSIQGTPYTTAVLSPSETTFGSDFPSSTIARSTSFPEGTVDQYFSTSGAGIQYWGSAVSAGGFSINTVYSNAELAYPIPMTYNSQGSDTYVNQTEDFLGASISTGSLEWSTPGYGTLLINGETYEDVILYRWHRVDTNEVAIGTITLTTYSDEWVHAFLAAGYHYPIALFSEVTSQNDFTPLTTTYSGSILLDQVAVGLQETSMDMHSIDVYPNPCRSGEPLNVSYSLSRPQSVSIELIDVQGRVVFSESQNMPAGQVKQSIPLSSVSRGAYLLTLRAEEGTWTERVQVD